MKQLRIQKARDEEILLEYSSFKIIRYIESQLVKELIFYLTNNDEYISVSTFNNKVKIEHTIPADPKQIKYKYLSISKGSKTFGQDSTAEDLKMFAESLKSGGNNLSRLQTHSEQYSNRQALRQAPYTSEQELKKSAEIIIPSFISQLTKMNINVKAFTEQQTNKFMSSLDEFIKNTGNVKAQKTIFTRFVNWLSKS
ncbi:hypothetical protein B5G52_04140 [Pseudoalteromonas sp. A601]|uniref:hypothetical protein n=1 Tax=Pseudoalteromonas sp. A601 TaxID=1967839 RepID=UPI000B3BFC33|nr:hypothetical protein [Pseudoalteromonas sp. A601]OUS73443.1 hypothetical protein B5G52_04140 [Pseudoalteromonas sp. A601]